MDCGDVRQGILVRTNKHVDDPDSTKGFLIKEEYITARKSNVAGQVQSYVPGHGGDIWFVRHEDGSVGAYGFPELDRLDMTVQEIGEEEGG